MEDRFIVGIDVAKDKVDIVFGEHRTHMCVQNTPEKLRELCETYFVQGSVIGLESTGEYHIPIIRVLQEYPVTIRLINPLVTKAAGSGHLRGNKTDPLDAETIWRLTRDGFGQRVTGEIMSAEKELIRIGYFLTRTRVSLSQRTQSVRRKHIDLDVLERIDSIAEQIRDVEQHITQAVTQAPDRQAEVIASIPGFGPKLASTISHECGDIASFQDSAALVAYAGLDPRRKQSGTSLDAHGRLSKRGSSILRTSLFLAANVARRYDRDLCAYYDKKRDQQRSHREVLCMIARKLVQRIWVLIRDDRLYEKSTP